MAGGPQARMLPGGRRLHLQHGPIDLVIQAFGPEDEIVAAYAQAWRRFQTVLPELVEELPLLRRPVDAAHPGLEGPVARRMFAACWPLRSVFITPMAAVAGSVADEVLAAMLAGRNLERAYVNNGGDIAIHLASGAALEVGLVANVDHPSLDGIARIDGAWPVRGVATSGWRGRSFSLGIADSVTVLAETAAVADAAVTLVANAVNLDHPAVERTPAHALDPDSDLGARLVTTRVDALPAPLVDMALAPGVEIAERMHGERRIFGAVLALQGEMRVVGGMAPRLAAA